MFRCWGWNNEVSVFDTLTATYRSSGCTAFSPACFSVTDTRRDYVTTVLCLLCPGSRSGPQRLPRQRPSGEQGLHLWRRGELPCRLATYCVLHSEEYCPDLETIHVCRRSQSWTCSAWTWRRGPGLNCKCPPPTLSHTKQ